MKVAIMGYGTIGSGVAAVLERNRESIAAKAGDVLEVKYVLDLREFPGIRFRRNWSTTWM